LITDLKLLSYNRKVRIFHTSYKYVRCVQFKYFIHRNIIYVDYSWELVHTFWWRLNQVQNWYSIEIYFIFPWGSVGWISAVIFQHIFNLNSIHFYYNCLFNSTHDPTFNIVQIFTDLEIECFVVSSTINLIFGFICTNVRATSYLPKQTKLTSI
jgi:hypothetical protein